MMHRRTSGGKRAAFTMIELMIVIAIIAVLVAMLASGVFRVMALGQRTEVASDIMKMDQSLKVAMQTYNGVQFLPSQLVLYNDIASYRSTTASALDKQSANVLRAMFGKRFITNGGTVAWGVPNNTTLNGAECLVFYLGGNNYGGLPGFSANPLNPTDNNTQRIGPFFEFKKTNNRWSVPSGRLARYLDPYGTPYVYFGPTAANTYNATDNSSFNVAPYYEAGSSPTRYLNPNTFQIISAGKDHNFGPGGSWNPQNGTCAGDTNNYRVDDLSNFSQTELGDGQM